MKKFNDWLINRIEKGKLTNLLSFLFSDTEHIKNCYEPSAFIRQEDFQNALMTCILAIEYSQLSLLTKINPELYSDDQLQMPGHRRASSHPIFSSTQKSSMKKVSRSSSDCTKAKVDKARPWKSVPNLHHETFAARRRTQTISSSESWKLQKKVSFKSAVEASGSGVIPPEEDVPYFEYRDSSARIKAMRNCLSDPNPKAPVRVLKVDDIKIHTDYRYSADYQKSPITSRPKVATKRLSMFSFLDQAAEASKLSSSSAPTVSVSPTDVFFSIAAVPGDKMQSTSPVVKSLEEPTRKRKSSRQNLAYFLQALNSGSRTKIDLDRENAHFLLSEAIIAASEQLKWTKILDQKYKIPKDVRIKDDLLLSPSRPFKRPMPPVPRENPKFVVGSIEDDSESSLSNDETSTDKRTNSTSSDDLNNENTPQMEWNVAEDPHSAESIARILMTKFKNQLLPNPSSMLWMVNESQAPQQLLPFPDAFSHHIICNPDEPFHLNTFIRGSKDWAPPRHQVIFTVHPAPDRKRQMQQQMNRCAGCGMKVQPAYMHTFRYCEYLGKYFCSACHKNQISTIPARVLDKFDFSLFPVSNFSYKWLDEIWCLPLFHVGDLKPQLYDKSKALRRARLSRLSLKYVQDFIEQCRFAQKEQEYCKEIPTHWTDDVDIWSMTDFVDVKNNVFTERIQEVIRRLEEHIFKLKCEVRRFFFVIFESSNKSNLDLLLQEQLEMNCFTFILIQTLFLTIFIFYYFSFA